MNGTELVMALATLVFAAFLMGWFARWAVHRFLRTGPEDAREFNKMVRSLHEAEEARDRANASLEKSESEMARRLAQTEAELSAAMAGLREARIEVGELRALAEGRDNGKGDPISG